MAQKQQEGSRFTPETSQMALKQRYHPEFQDLRSASRDAHRSESDNIDSPRGKTSHGMAKRVGISSRTYERVRYIVKEGSKEQIEKLRLNKGSIRQAYEQLKFEKLRDRLETRVTAGIVVDNDDDYVNDDNYGTSKNEKAGIAAKTHHNEEAADRWKRKEEENRGFNKDSSNMHLLNKDFRLVTQEEMPDWSMDLVLVLQFPDPKIPEDEGGRIHEQLIERSSRWLKEGSARNTCHLLPRLICCRPSAFQFYRLVCVHYVGHDKESGIVSGLNVSWRPYIVFVKDPPETQPLIESGLQTINAKTEMDVARALVAGLSLHGGSVCDPFMGKGIVGKATMAVEGGRKYIGIERDHGLFLSAVDALGGRRCALCVSRTRTLALNTVHSLNDGPALHL
jgi:hypothetical protein